MTYLQINFVNFNDIFHFTDTLVEGNFVYRHKHKKKNKILTPMSYDGKEMGRTRVLSAMPAQ